MDNPKYKDLKGKVVAITGGGGILCSTLAHAFAGQGAKVCVMDLNMESAQTVADMINKSGNSAMAVKVDVLDRESLDDAKNPFQSIFAQFLFCHIPLDLLFLLTDVEVDVGD